MTTATPAARGSIFGQLYVQVLIAVAIGIFIGHFFPAFGVSLKPLGDGFIRLIRMLVGPVIFGTMVVGIARMENLKDAGRTGLKALVYFEIVSTLALVIGLIVVNLFEPGAGMHADVAKLDASKVANYASAAPAPNVPTFLLNVIPTSIFDAFARNDMLQIILFSVLLGVAMAHHRRETQPLFDVIEAGLQALFFIVGLVIRLAPLGALGGIAYTVGEFGIGSLGSYAKLILCLYISSLLFVFVGLGAVMRLCGLSLWKFLRYIKDEIIVVFATVSTESVLPRLMKKLEAMGCAKPVVRMVLPAGYSFNLDGTSIYLTMAAVFLAQAIGLHLTVADQLGILAVLLLTSKGSGGVAGAGFVALAATLSSQSKIPVASLVLLLGVDRFLNEARGVTNLIGNGVATIAVAAWENSLDRARAREVLDAKTAD